MATSTMNNRINKTGIALIVFSAFVATASAFADTYTQTYSTADAYMYNWQVSCLKPAGYVNPNAGASNNYTKFDSSYLKNDLSWGDVQRTSKSGAWTTGGTGWISPDYTDPNGREKNGFYFYKFGLSAMDSGVTSIGLDAVYAADDYLAAVFVLDAAGNATQLYTGALSKNANSQNGEWNHTASGNLGDFNVVAGELYSLIFVIHNTNGGGSDVNNATGLNIEFTVKSDIRFNPPPETVDPPAVTPEPATLALFGIGLAGLAIARRRRK